MRIDGFQGSIVAKAFYLLAGFFAYMGFQNVRAEDSDLLISLTLALLAGISGAIGVGIDRLASRIRQSIRDSRAKSLHDEIKYNIESGKATWYFLFLRPFYLTRALPQRDQKQATANPFLPAHWQDKHVDFETLLARSVNRFGPVVALGFPGEAIGAGRIEVDEEQWKAEVELLATHARGIILIPSYRTGTMWEIDWLKNQKMLSHCVFVMPPDGFDYEIDLATEWDKTGRHVESMSIELPPYDAHGMLFRLNNDGKILSQAPMNATSDAEFESSLRSLLKITDEELEKVSAADRPEELPIESEEYQYILYGAELISDSVDYFPDWSAAMLREFDNVSKEKLPQMFDIAERLAEHPQSRWQELITDWNSGEVD